MIGGRIFFLLFFAWIWESKVKCVYLKNFFQLYWGELIRIYIVRKFPVSINTSVTSCIFLFLFSRGWEHLSSTLLANSAIQHSIINMVTILIYYIRSSDFANLKVCVLLPTSPYYLHPLTPDNHLSTLSFYELDLFF